MFQIEINWIISFKLWNIVFKEFFSDHYYFEYPLLFQSNSPKEAEGPGDEVADDLQQYFSSVCAHSIQLKSKMADSDDEDTFVTIGTPVDVPEEDAPRKKAVPIHEQIVTDSGGRRRFHGAFTGGFSAGHFNTVGTKEGWTPSMFVSSRSKKGEERQAQRPEDFMDEEDFDEYGIAPKKIVTKQEFLSTTRQELETRRKRDAVLERSSEHGIPGIPPLQDLVVPTRMSIGVDLLKQMGWKEGQGVGARVRRAKKKVAGHFVDQTDYFTTYTR